MLFRRKFEANSASRIPAYCGNISTATWGELSEAAIFIHGNSSCKEVFSNQIAAVRKLGLGAIALDLPGHGKSDDGSDPQSTYSFPGYARAVGDVLNALDCRKAHVVGWSLGGHVGLELLARDRRVQSLAIVGTPPVRPSPDALIEAFASSPAMRFAGQEHFSEADARDYGTLMLGARKLLTPELLAAIRRTDGRARRYMVTNGIAGVGIDGRSLVLDTDRPLAILHGERDPFVRLDYLRSLPTDKLWGGKVHVLARAGHAPHLEKPKQFNRMICNFLRQPKKNFVTGRP